tara:strand:+ start:454 stop:867 length:414 start_codon:yes stop_codon:yes gene_type:complete
MRDVFIQSEDRVKNLGEVFTPGWLVNEMLDQLPPELWDDPSTTYIDPACGNGNILLRVVRRKIKNGSSPLQALRTTYGVDIMQDNVESCRRRLLSEARRDKKQPHTEEYYLHEDTVKANIRCANTLEQSLEEIFDAQ